MAKVWTMEIWRVRKVHEQATVDVTEELLRSVAGEVDMTDKSSLEAALAECAEDNACLMDAWETTDDNYYDGEAGEVLGAPEWTCEQPKWHRHGDGVLPDDRGWCPELFEVTEVADAR